MIDSTDFDSTDSATVEGNAPPLTALVAAFKALGDPTRAAIIGHLTAGTHCVCELQTALDLPANLLSHHLRVLREAGLVHDQRRGRWIDYSLEPGALRVLQAALADCEPPTTDATTTDAPDTSCARPVEATL
ncbi:MAG: metalloregulator ArsR/SmtB family transcription factor [Trueperaceae bacterium]|nr:metalloregulator ArsR/SmtB family transcription factor [Trueperaceae bacterium]